jgi:adenylate cyclase
VGAEAGGRRLAAILAADVVGYSRLIGADEPGTLARLAALRSTVIDPQMAEYGGRVFKTTGDGLLAEFASGVQAVQCAIAIQQAMRAEEGIELRIGLHSADVTVQPDGDLLGDGVNVAARLEGLAEPGGICISGRVREDAAGKVTLDVEDLGEPELKNIAQRHRVFRVRFGVPDRPALPLPDKPSIAVLPFQNMSGDPEQEYFVDGLVEDITTALSCIRSLFVIARNSAFTYKGRAVDVRQVGRELGVRYVLEGSVRKAGSRLRITGQLVDAVTGAHLWANRFDGALEDVFDLQDQITSNVAGAIEPHLQRAEIERAQRKPTNDLGAYDYYLRGIGVLQQGRSRRAAEAQALFAKAYELDPEYGAAYGRAAICVFFRRNDLLAATAPEIAEGIRLARVAAEKGSDDAEALAYAGFVLAWLADDLDAGALLSERACTLNPNSAVALAVSGWVTLPLGNPEAAIAKFERGMRLSPTDPNRGRYFSAGIARAHFNAARYEEAISWSERALSEQPGLGVAHHVRAAAYAMAGRSDQAHRAMAALLADEPEMRLSNFIRLNWRRPDDYARMFEGLRLAGMPE